MKRPGRVLLGGVWAAAIAAMLAACGGSDSSSSTAPPTGGNPPEEIQGVATPSSVAVVTATNAD